jgi:hypothetical protein
MVRLGEKRSLLEASCCSLEVMNGAGGFLRRSFRSTEVTRRLASRTSVSMARASPSCGISGFCPSSRTTLAVNGGGTLPSTVASMVQYSTGTNALISASRSATSRTATDCTRPAESPRFTLVHRTGLIS